MRNFPASWTGTHWRRCLWHQYGSRRGARGTSRRAIEEYVAGIARVLGVQSQLLGPDAPVIVVVNDRRDLYPEILERSSLTLVDRLERHVNRRTGRRAGEYFESILVCVRER